MSALHHMTIWRAFLLGTVLALVLQRSDAANSIPVPQLVCTNEFWDFGRQPNTNCVEHVFELANEGTAELKITRVHTTCGCTAARTGTDRVAPGGKTAVTVQFNLAGRTGAQHKSIYIDSNDPQNPIVRLEVTGEAVGTAGNHGAGTVTVNAWDGRARVQPGRVDFGRVKAGAITEGEILLRGTSSNDVVTVVDIVTGNTGLTTRVERGAGECRVVLRLAPGVDLGPGAATVAIRTSHPDLKTVNVPVTWLAEGDLYAIPEEVTVVAVSGLTHAATRYVAIRSRSGKSFRLAAVDVGPHGGMVELSALSGGTGVLLKLSGLTAVTNGISRSIAVRVDDGFGLTIPIKTVVALAEGQ